MNQTTLPRAYAGPLVEGLLRSEPADFCVDEMAAIVPTGAGEHLWVRIEKTDVNTHAVAAELARAFECELGDVSYAGMKDRRAIARQWFSVRTPRDATAAVGAAGWRVVEAHRHARKLRRGELAGNAFRIRIRCFTGDRDGAADRLATLAAHGVPNYFGEQRFGRDGGNVERARAWICRRPRPPVSVFQKGLHLSTARALLFNAVLAQRIVDASWNVLVDGDVATDGVPTGPLWGRGRVATSGRARDLEIDALGPLGEWLDPLEHLGLVQERRTFVARPRALRWSVDGDDLELAFELPAGQYATALLRELGDIRVAHAEAVA